LPRLRRGKHPDFQIRNKSNKLNQGGRTLFKKIIILFALMPLLSLAGCSKGKADPAVQQDATQQDTKQQDAEKNDRQNTGPHDIEGYWELVEYQTDTGTLAPASACPDGYYKVKYFNAGKMRVYVFFPAENLLKFCPDNDYTYTIQDGTLVCKDIMEESFSESISREGDRLIINRDDFVLFYEENGERKEKTVPVKEIYKKTDESAIAAAQEKCETL